MLQACNRPTVFERPGRVLRLVLEEEPLDSEFRADARGQDEGRIPFSKADCAVDGRKGEKIPIALQQASSGRNLALLRAGIDHFEGLVAGWTPGMDSSQRKFPLTFRTGKKRGFHHTYLLMAFGLFVDL